MISFSESVNAELESTGVAVTALCPGFTRSEFHDVLGTRAAMGALPRFLWMDAADVARQGYAPVPCPTTKNLENLFYANAQTVAAAAFRLVRPNETPWEPSYEESPEIIEFKGPF